MRDLVRCSAWLLTTLTVCSAGAADLRWTFDSLPADSLVGDAKTALIGPTGEFFQGLPAENMALRLDGDGDYVRVADPGDQSELDFAQGEPITIEAWVRLDRIDNGQNVYIVGKGRTHLQGPKDNQNYALRLRGAGDQARVSFLFRSQAADQQPSDWHRWTSKRGFYADGDWHHVAVSYQFGESKSIRGYVDGESVGGSWDMGGATNRPPIVDDDELWIGSSLGGGAGTSLCGAIDELVIARQILPPESFTHRRMVIAHPPQVPAEGLTAGMVTVQVHENSDGGWPIHRGDAVMKYEQSALAFPRIPVPYREGGVRRDWQGQLMFTAMTEVVLPPAEIQWMVRAGGLSRLWVGDQVIVETPAHLGPTSGHGEVVPYSEPDPWLRPLHPGHHQRTGKSTGDGSTPVLITLQTKIGGNGLRYEAGEIIVAFRADSDDPWQVLAPGGWQVPLTDDGWQPLEQRLRIELQRVDDRHRRLAAEVEDEFWHRRHQHARQFVESLDPIELPADTAGLESASPIDRFIHARIAGAGQAGELSPLTEDAQFIRRLYLDTVGVIPTPDEIAAFESALGDAPARRAEMIDRVLEDPRWADHWASYWMDVLAENPNVLKPSLNNSGPFRWYLYDVLRDNTSLDRWVTGLIRMNGSSRYGGPAGFGLAAQNDVPMAAKAHVLTSAFLGANMKCARCHDAPYHDWTQKDLFSIAAMLGRKPIKVPATSSVPEDFFGEGGQDSSLISLSIHPGDAIEANWPLSDYTSKAPLAESLLPAEADSRARLAAHLTRPENQQFARTVVNRLWQRLLGEGLVEPVEDWEGSEPSHPDLLEYLARELTANDYDLKHVARLILNSQTYQRQATDRSPTRDETERLFATPRLRRMTAEQVVDSLHTAVGRPLDAGRLTFDPEARMKPSAQSNLGRPRRAWQLTSLSNERDRPALSLPRASAVCECLEAFGWSGARQDPINHRQTAANVLQPAILGNGLLSIQLTRLVDGDAVTSACLQADSPAALLDDLFLRFLTRKPTADEREQFQALLEEGFEQRVLSSPLAAETPIREPHVSWANHLHPQATEVRLRESDRLRLGPEPSRWLDTDWRQRAEDAVWALINTPEFVFVP